MKLQPAPTLQLKDVHPGIAPDWWPPAPGWWLLLGIVLLLALWLGRRWLRRQRRRRELARYFDEALAQAATPTAQIAAMSALLRRAARRIDPDADRLQGEAWLAFLDAGLKPPAFLHGPGALLADGAFRPAANPAAVEALRVVARRRYLQWMRRA